MTKQRDLKALVRERMAKTGERYAAARAHILSKASSARPQQLPGILDGYDRFGGVQAGTGPLTNTLRFLSIRPTGAKSPLGEAAVNGICGGPGFLYAVFQYKGWPPILSLALHSRSMPDIYIGEGLKRLGLQTTVHETTSTASAQKALDRVLEAGDAAICVVDVASLPWYGLPSEFIGAGPHVVSVIGHDNGSYWIDDRSSRPRLASAEVLARARAAYRQARNRLITLKSTGGVDLRRAASDAIADTARRYEEPAVPKSFWVNCGWRGLAKWQAMLVDRKNKSGWPNLFADGPKAYAGLQRAYESIACQQAPGAGRDFYATFLDEAATMLGRPALKRAAAEYRRAGAAWDAIAGLIAGLPDKAIRDACSIADRRLALGDAAGQQAKDSADLWARRLKLGADCRLSSSDALDVYERMSALVGDIIVAERAAVAAMV
jgi:hypothetical protein